MSKFQSMPRIPLPNGEGVCQMQINHIWNELLMLQSHVHQQSLLQQDSCSAMHFTPDPVCCNLEYCEVPSHKARHSRPNRKGLKERLRQKQRVSTTPSVPTSGCDESSSEGHKIWHSGDDSVQADTLAELTSMQEKLFAHTDNLRAREVEMVDRELRFRDTELAEDLHREKTRADQAVARANRAEDHFVTLSHSLECRVQAAEQKVSDLESALESEATQKFQLQSELQEMYSSCASTANRAQKADQKAHDLEDAIRDDRNRIIDQQAKLSDLQAKLIEAEFESGRQIARAFKLEQHMEKLEHDISELKKKLRDAEIESGKQTTRAFKFQQKTEKLELKLRDAEIESGTLTARAMQFQARLAELEGWFHIDGTCTDL